MKITNIIDKIYEEDKSGEERDYYLDNVRYVMMLLVVIGHFINNVGLEKYKNLYTFIYLFHMPCFVFLSGYFAKGLNKGGRLRVEKVISVFWLYIIMKIVNFIIMKCFGAGTTFHLFYEGGAPWYLLCLTAWYLMVPFLMQVKPKIMIIISISIALSAGYDIQINKMFSFSRMLVFFPFFLLGYYCSKELLIKFRKLNMKFFALLLVTGVFCVVLLYGRNFKIIQSVLYGAMPYKTAFKKFPEWGILIRGLWYIGTFIFSGAIMLLIPRCEMFFTKLGQRTLQVYIVHYLIRTILAQAGFFIWMKQSKVTALMVLPFSILLAFLLGTKSLQRFFEVISGQRVFKRLIKNKADC